MKLGDTPRSSAGSLLHLFQIVNVFINFVGYKSNTPLNYQQFHQFIDVIYLFNIIEHFEDLFRIVPGNCFRKSRIISEFAFDLFFTQGLQ